MAVIARRPPTHLLASCRLQQVTWVCREEVAACPSYVHKRLAPLMRLLKTDAQQHHQQRQGQKHNPQQQQQQQQQPGQR